MTAREILSTFIAKLRTSVWASFYAEELSWPQLEDWIVQCTNPNVVILHDEGKLWSWDE